LELNLLVFASVHYINKAILCSWKSDAGRISEECFNSPDGDVKTYLLAPRGCIHKFPDRVDNEIYAYNNKHTLRSNTKGYGGKTHYTDSQNSDTTACRGRELYHLQLSLQAASPETVFRQL
jgi:hypothetical protein